MVDKVYKASLPVFRKRLEALTKEFSELTSQTDWYKLRIEPLMDHLRSLEQLTSARRYSQEFSRLRRGVVMFHSDLVYFRTNIQALEKILHSRKGAVSRTAARKRRTIDSD